MREKYLKKLLKLLIELQVDYRDNKLDDWSRQLYWLLQKVLTAFWFYQIDGLHQHVCQFQLALTMPVTEDAAELARQYVEEVESLAADAAAFADKLDAK